MLTTLSTAPITYVNIVNGFFAVRVEPDTPGSVKRQKKSGFVVWEMLYNQIAGFVESVDYKRHDHEGLVYRSLIITLRSESGVFKVSADVMTDPANVLFHVLPNIQPAFPILIKIWKVDQKTNMVVYQHGKALTWAYTNKEPNGRPNWDKKEVVDLDGKSVITWDKTAQIAWFIQQLPEQNKRFTNDWAIQDKVVNPANGDPEQKEESNFVITNQTRVTTIYCDKLDDLPF